jgi:tetratricopeptide (TPR) repeat protein
VLFAEANELLAEAFEMTVSNQARISEEMVIASEKEWEARYYAAKDLEFQFQYEAAVEAYKVIDEEWPDGFMDVKARITDLQESTAMAEKAYLEGQEAEKEGDIPAAVEAYRRSLLYYPTYKGLEKKIESLVIGR